MKKRGRIRVQVRKGEVTEIGEDEKGKGRGIRIKNQKQNFA